MKRFLSAACVLAFSAAVLAQEADSTTVTTTTRAGGFDSIGELWSFEDAVPLCTGRVDLRLTGAWSTASAPANLGDSSDDYVIQPSLVWGVAENLELSANVPVWVGDAGDRPGGLDGNADTNVGLLWRFMEQDGGWPAMALSAHGRFPTGDNSSGVDGELRLIMTNDYDSCIRSHINLFGITVNGNDSRDGRDVGDTRDFQWGAVIGLDGPLCSDGAVRWVVDYLHRSSFHNGQGNINLVDVGWEWSMGSGNGLGMSFQVGLDRSGETPNFGATVTYSMALVQ